MSKNGLKPCPFCGGEAEIIEQNNGFHKWCQAFCVNCRVSQCGIEYKTIEQAIVAWNKRTCSCKKS